MTGVQTCALPIYQKKTLIEMIIKKLPQAADKIHYISKDEDPRDYRVNFDRIKNSLRFKNRKTVTDGINEYIELIKSGTIKEPDSSIYKNL